VAAKADKQAECRGSAFAWRECAEDAIQHAILGGTAGQGFLIHDRVFGLGMEFFPNGKGMLIGVDFGFQMRSLVVG
jgi:hypothetical protein